MATEGLAGTQFKLRIDSIQLDAAIRAGAVAANRSLNMEMIHALTVYYGLSTRELDEPSPTAKVLTTHISQAAMERLQKAAQFGVYAIAINTIVERGIELAATELDGIK